MATIFNCTAWRSLRVFRSHQMLLTSCPGERCILWHLIWCVFLTNDTHNGCKAEFILECKAFFSSPSRMRVSVFEVMSVYSIDQYQNAVPKAMLLYELKKILLQERFTLMTYDSIGLLKQTLHEFFVADRCCWVWIKTLQLTTQCWKNASISEWIQLDGL